ncbi:cytochrome P450 [Nesterenkonia haasae]|uniref:cytochrome P450 n=1 Tax=Nesterenkonia haasae TaxID=2587813 RepID=UPI00139191D9|nr:cytochrome P450 [Nesterenkonia haasae]NDK31265.1 cytochrome P450 [Nesterenkonia haasae]
MTKSISPEVPTVNVDPFSRESLSNPQHVDRLIREAGEVVWLEEYGIWATGRHDVVERIFRDYENFESSAGTGLTNIKKEKNWRKPSVILENDPPDHTRYRRIMTSVLSQRVIRRLKESFQEVAEELVLKVIHREEFDGATELAEAYPLQVLPDAVGFAPEGRHHLLPYSNLNFQAMGPRNEFYFDALEHAQEATEYVSWQVRREALAPGGLGRKIYGYADEGEITEEDAAMLVRTFLSAGVDTTIFALQFTLKALAETPEAWAFLREDPNRAQKVFEESLRCYPSSPYIGRTTRHAVTISDVRFEPEQKVMLLLAAANHDPRRWKNPEAFDVHRETAGHLAFGTGIHGCVGQMMARMEATSLLSALARHTNSLELVGDAKPFYSNWLRGFTSLPMRATPA